MGRGDKHLVGDALCASRINRETYRGKDVHVVPLPGHESAVAESDRWKWAATREDSTSFRPPVRFLRGTLQMRGWIGVGEDNRASVHSRHRFDHALIECL